MWSNQLLSCVGPMSSDVIFFPAHVDEIEDINTTLTELQQALEVGCQSV